MKLIKVIVGPRSNSAVKVYFDCEWSEYVVKPTLNEGTWYHTDNREDALRTALVMAWA